MLCSVASGPLHIVHLATCIKCILQVSRPVFEPGHFLRDCEVATLDLSTLGELVWYVFHDEVLADVSMCTLWNCDSAALSRKRSQSSWSPEVRERTSYTPSVKRLLR